jgi:hypothetical protein
MHLDCTIRKGITSLRGGMLRDESTIHEDGRTIFSYKRCDKMKAICTIQNARAQKHRMGVIPRAS